MHLIVRVMPRSTRSARKTVRNTQIPSASLGFSPLELDPAFPLRIVLDGRRDDQAITLLHVHDALEIGCCLEGSGTFYVGSKVLSFQAGDVTVITDREYHRCRSSPGTTSRWAWFFLHPSRLIVPHAAPSLVWEPERLSGPRFENVLTEKAQPWISTLVRQIILEAREPDGASRQNLRCLFVLLINELHRRFKKPKQSGKARPLDSPARLAPALELITSQFQEPLSVPQMAKTCGMSVRSFEGHFDRLMGQPPSAYLIRCRVQAAATLLRTSDRTIAEVAYECGFGTLSSFNRAFQKHMGQTPREHRNQSA
jgi:AraC-like DNA-binding protein